MTLFYKRLEELMLERGYSPTELADISIKYSTNGVVISKQNINQWKVKDSLPNTQKLGLLAKIFNVNPNYLIGNTDQKSYDQELMEKEVQICNLMQLCYGKEAYQIVEMYLSLNEDGKKTAFERIQELTELDKFVKRELEERKFG